MSYRTFVPAFALAALGLTLTGCQQAPPAAPAVTVVEPAHSDDADARRRQQDADARARQDRSHPPTPPPADRDHH